MATYSIRDLEKISGIKAHTLRVWEQRYSVLPPKRTKTNIRYYDEDDLRLLLSISMLNSHGIKISKIAKMDRKEIHHKVAELRPYDCLKRTYALLLCHYWHSYPNETKYNKLNLPIKEVRAAAIWSRAT